MRITRTLRIFTYFSAKTNPETKTSVLGREKTETDTKLKIPQAYNTTAHKNREYQTASTTVFVSKKDKTEKICITNMICGTNRA